MKLESFAFIGIKNLVIKDRETHATKCLLPHLVNLSLNDETARDYLRGGLGNPKPLFSFFNYLRYGIRRVFHKSYDIDNTDKSDNNV